MTSVESVLQSENTTTQHELRVSFELGDRSWRLSCSDGIRSPRRYSVKAGDQAAVLDCIDKARGRCGLDRKARVHTCYEAGRDGWWLHRWLREQEIDSIVVDSSSIEVNRRAKRAKTDQLDADKLLALLLRYHRGERSVWSVLHEPTAQEEDARRTHREVARLMHERIAHTNRIGSLLVMHNLRPDRIGGRTWQAWWDSYRVQVPPLLRAEIEHEYARLVLVKQPASHHASWTASTTTTCWPGWWRPGSASASPGRWRCTIPEQSRSRSASPPARRSAANALLVELKAAPLGSD